jgi:hypothetical protein
MMPEGSASSRGAQKSALAGVLYDKRTEKELGQLLEQLKGAAGLDPVQAAVVREAQRLEPDDLINVWLVQSMHVIDEGGAAVGLTRCGVMQQQVCDSECKLCVAVFDMLMGVLLLAGHTHVRLLFPRSWHSVQQSWRQMHTR